MWLLVASHVSEEREPAGPGSPCARAGPPHLLHSPLNSADFALDFAGLSVRRVGRALLPARLSQGGWRPEERRWTVTSPGGEQARLDPRGYTYLFIYSPRAGLRVGQPRLSALSPESSETPAPPSFSAPPCGGPILRPQAPTPRLWMCPPVSQPCTQGGRMDKHMEPKLQRPAEPDSPPPSPQGRALCPQSWSPGCRSAGLASSLEGARLPPERERDAHLIRLYKIIIITKTKNTQFGSPFSSTDFSIMAIKLFLSFVEPLLSLYTDCCP